MPHPFWPFFDLRIRTPRLELRPACSVEDVTALASLAADGIHDPDFMPFLMPWTEAPSPELERNSIQHYWQSWGKWSASDWRLPFATVADGEVVGTQAVHGREFAVRRTVDTGSWLGQRFQGRGIGKEMRAAVLHFAFSGLGAMRAETGAFSDNGPSLGVTRSLGYEPNGDEVRARRGAAAVELRFKMDRATWEARRRDDIEIDGLDACLPLLGAVSAADR